MNEEKRCKACKRIIVGEGEFCPACKNKYEERAVVGVGALGLVAGVVWQIIKRVKK